VKLMYSKNCAREFAIDKCFPEILCTAQRRLLFSTHSLLFLDDLPLPGEEIIKRTNDGIASLLDLTRFTRPIVSFHD
jgi:hypothetical protein